MDERLFGLLDSSIISIAENWKCLTTEDLRELFNNEIEQVYAVYDSWKELVTVEIKEDIPKYMIPFIDIDGYADYKKETNEGGMYITLKSGKVIAI